MLLIGQFDSPFVRRVGVALQLYDMAYEHRPWSVFGDADKVAAYTPLRRVPALVLDDGEVLVDSASILDALDGMVGPERALVPPGGAERRAAMRVCALAAGAAEKAVSLVYERMLHARATPAWIERCQGQIHAVLDALEADRARRAAPYWHGGAIGHGDIMAACLLRFLSEAHPGLFDPAAWPALTAHAARCEALPAFQRCAQPFTYIPPKEP
jgi:glutathione S-transferase